MSLLSQEIQPNGIQIPPLQTLALNSVCRNPSILKTRKINNLPYPLLEALFLRLQREYKIRLELLPHFRNLQKCSLVTSATHDMELQNGWIEEFTHWESLKKLNLLNCQLNATSFKALGTLTQLEILKIGPYEKHSCEKMEGSLFKEFLSKMTNLRALTLFKFDGDIKIEWFSKLKHLNSLRLKICHFYSDYSALTSLTNLTDLELSGIQFDFDNKDKGLLKLFKKNSGLPSWPMIERLTSLISLNLSSTNVTLKQLEPLTSLTCLKRLDISATEVRPCNSFREIFSKMTFLDYLGCVGNQFYPSMSKIDKLKLVGESCSLMEALQYCKMNITNATLVKKKMSLNLTRDNTPRNRKELELLFKIIEYHMLNEEPTTILKDCLRLMTHWVDDCFHWIFGKLEYACPAIVALMNMHYDKPVMADLCWLVTRLFLKVETSVNFKIDLCELIRCGIVDILHKARLTNKKTNNFEMQLKIVQAIASMGSIGSHFFTRDKWNGERPLKDLLSILRSLKRNYQSHFVNGTSEQRNHFRDIVRWSFWGLYCQVLKDSKSNYWELLMQNKHIDTLFFFLNESHAYAFKNTTCLLMSLASKPKFQQILFERTETFPFLKTIFRTIVDKQVIRYAGAIIENMAMDKERVHIFRQHEDLLGLMVEKCRMMDLDTGLEISHGIKELCKKNNEIQKLFLEMEKGLKYMVETLNQVNSVGTKCYDIIVVIVDAIRGIVENHEENQIYLAENLGTDWIAKLIPFMDSTTPLVVNNVLVTLHGIIFPIILVAERHPESVKHPLRFQQRFVDERGFHYLLKLLNNPNQSKDILENCLLIAGNFMWNNNESRKIALQLGLLEPFVRATVNNNITLFPNSLRHFVQCKDETVKKLFKQEVLRDGSVALLSEYISDENNWNSSLERLKHICYIILHFTYLDHKICSKLRRCGALDSLTKLLIHSLNQIKNPSKLNNDNNRLDNCTEYDDIKQKLWREIVEYTSHAISMMCSDDLPPKSGKCCFCLSPIVKPGVIRYQCQICDTFNLCFTCYNQKLPDIRHPQDHFFVEDDNKTCTYVYMQNGYIKILLDYIKDEHMYDTSVLGDLLRIVVGMTYQNSEAAHYIAKETDLLKTITFIIKTRKELPKTLYSTVQNILYYKESQNKILENSELVYSLVMLLRDKSLERQDDVLKAIKNIPEDILVKLGVLDILMNDWLLSNDLHLQRTALKTLTSLIFVTNTKKTIFRELESRRLVPFLLLLLLKDDAEIRKFASNLIIPKRENLLVICEHVSMLLNTLRLKTTALSSHQSLPLLVEWSPNRSLQSGGIFEELKRTLRDLKQTEKRGENSSEIGTDKKFNHSENVNPILVQTRPNQYNRENIPQTTHQHFETSSRSPVHYHQMNSSDKVLDNNSLTIELPLQLSLSSISSLPSFSSHIKNESTSPSSTTLMFFPTLRAISEPLISKTEAVLNNVLGAVQFMLASSLEHVNLVRNTPLISQLCETLKLCSNNVALIDTVASILFHLTGDSDSWIYEEIVKYDGHKIVADLIVSQSYWTCTHTLLLGVGGSLCKKNKAARQYWCSRRDILETIFNNLHTETHDNKLTNTIYLFYNMVFRNNEFMRQVLDSKKNKLFEMLAENSTNAEKLAACRILTVLGDNYYSKSFFENFIQPCVSILRRSTLNLLKVASLSALKAMIHDCPDTLKVVLDDHSFVGYLLEDLSTNSSPEVLRAVLNILIEISLAHSKLRKSSQLCEVSSRCSILLGEMALKSNGEQKDNENLYLASYVILILSGLCKKCNETVRTLSSFFLPLILCSELKTTFYGGLISVPNLICQNSKKKVLQWFKEIFCDERLANKFRTVPSELDKMNVIVGKILEGVKEEAENSENKMKYASVAFLCWCEIPCVSRLEIFRKVAPSLFALVLKGRNLETKLNIVSALHLILFWEPSMMKEIELFGLHNQIVDLFLDDESNERIKQVTARGLAVMADLSETIKSQLANNVRICNEIRKLSESDILEENLTAILLLLQLFPTSEVTALITKSNGIRKLIDVFDTKPLLWQCCASVALEYVARKYLPLLMEGEHLKECFTILSKALEMENLFVRESSCRCLSTLITQIKNFSISELKDQTKKINEDWTSLLKDLKEIVSNIQERIESLVKIEFFHTETTAPQLLNLLKTLQ